MYYVYVLRYAKDRLYIGYSSDLRRRFREHSLSKENCELLYYEAYVDKKTAIDRERQLKQYGGSWRSLKKRLGV
ncbi:MAG: GIY-YIG nuclease family protein [Candidatus Aminicenantes bacterium]|nr:GIY-YIG nuclease family protein [Candidatus Aminicenantes bacterium]